jgi:hypothetical protein
MFLFKTGVTKNDNNYVAMIHKCYCPFELNEVAIKVTKTQKINQPLWRRNLIREAVAT